MSFYVCKYCGAHLDPGERCDCQKEAIKPIVKKVDNPTGKRLVAERREK